MLANRSVIIVFVAVMSLMASSQEMIEHLVQRGETFALVAERYGITEQMLRNSNDHLDECYTGITLLINPADIETAREQRAKMEAERREREQYARYEQAWSLMDAKKYKDAQKIFDKIIAEAPTGLAYYNRGVCYYNREKWNDAARDFGFVDESGDCSDELKEKGRKLRKSALKNQEKKEERRAQMWAGIFGVGLGAASAAMNAYATSSTPYYAPTANSDYLLNPYYAATQVPAQQSYSGNYNAQVYSDPCVQASIAVANSSNVVMQANQTIMQQNQMAIDNGWYFTPTPTSTYDGDATYSSSSSGRQKEECRLCDGNGWIPETKGVPSFGNNKWCAECKKTVPANHYHTSCPSCNGEGEL